jgi:hypothetical protein
MAISDIPVKCRTCRFCKRFDDDVTGQCRAYPPVISKDSTKAEFPVVMLDSGWCGIHTPDTGLLMGHIEFDHEGHLNG